MFHDAPDRMSIDDRLEELAALLAAGFRVCYSAKWRPCSVPARRDYAGRRRERHFATKHEPR